MSKIRPLIEACVETQLELNAKVNPLWVNANYNWQLAAKVELAELIDHLGYKWWKLQEPDFEQAYIELIDILHFVVSDVMVQDKENEFVFTKVCNILESLSYSHTVYPLDPEKLMVSGENVGLLECFRMLRFLHKSPHEMFTMYLSKDILNLFRQDHGYKQGSYVKMWGNVEDNVVLSNIVKGFAFNLPNVKERLYKELSNEYNKATK